MRKKITGLFGASVIVVGMMMGLTGCSLFESSSEETTQVTTEEKDQKEKAKKLEYVVPTTKEEVFSEEVQNNMQKEIDQKLDQLTYTPEAPLVYYNPFGTNLRSANVYFTTEQPAKVEYEVSVEDESIPDFSRTLETGDESGFTKEHAYQLIGFVPNSENTVTLHIYNEAGEEIAHTSFTIQIPEIVSDAEEKIEVTKEKEEELENGLYTVVYGRRDSKQLNIDLYDENGILRGELYVDGYRTDRIDTIDNYLYYGVDENKIVKVNRLGKVDKVYDLGQYEMHHDLVYNEEKDQYLILVNDTKQETVEDMIVTLDLKTGEVKSLLDLKDILPEAYEKAVLPDSKSKLDWAHINAIQLINGTDVVLSFRELSSIVKVNNVYDKPELGYILSDKTVWEGTSYVESVYDKVGDFTAQGGQHAITYEKGDSEDEYYLYMFNNNFTYSGTRKDIDWSGYTLAQTPEDEKYSYYYKYKINETEGTFELVDSFEVPYSAYVSNVQKVGDHYIVCSGAQKIFGEYDSEGNLIREFKQEKEQYLYRTFKYAFDGIWFSN